MEVNYRLMVTITDYDVQRSKFIKSDTPFYIDLKNNER